MHCNGTAVLATLLAWNGPTAVVMLCERERAVNAVNAGGGNVSRREGNVPRCQMSSFMCDWTGLQNCQGVFYSLKSV
jgi:hypothetical protein